MKTLPAQMKSHPLTADTGGSGRLSVGLYGQNGHQLHGRDWRLGAAQLIAVAGLSEETTRQLVLETGCQVMESLFEMCKQSNLDIIVLCSPIRADQAADAIRCLEAGYHVYAEKPCALNEEDLDAIITAAKRTGRTFHEMGAWQLDPVQAGLKAMIEEGTIGEVVQIFMQKSYPWMDWRATDEEIDGGLGRQAGIYLARMVENTAGQRIRSVHMEETRLGNPVVSSQCRRAVNFSAALENGGLATGICNYLNPVSGIAWGYDGIRIFGTEGILEYDAMRHEIRLLFNDRIKEVDIPEAALSEFDTYLQTLLANETTGPGLPEELRPTRWIIRAKGGSRLNRGWVSCCSPE